MLNIVRVECVAFCQLVDSTGTISINTRNYLLTFLVQAKQREVTELLARADDLAVQNKSYQEVYTAMAQSLSEAWVDLNKQLDYRKMLLDQSINFHESALQVSRPLC